MYVAVLQCRPQQLKCAGRQSIYEGRGGSMEVGGGLGARGVVTFGVQMGGLLAFFVMAPSSGGLLRHGSVRRAWGSAGGFCPCPR
jgi:hypothetical protein